MQQSLLLSWWFAIDSGETWAQRNPCSSWAEVHGLSQAEHQACALREKLVGKGGPGGWQRLGANVLSQYNITRYEKPHGRNEEANSRISWACVGPRPGHIPIDQLRSTVSVPDVIRRHFALRRHILKSDVYVSDNDNCDSGDSGNEGDVECDEDEDAWN